MGAAILCVVTIASLWAPAQCLEAGSHGAEDEQSQDQHEHTPMHTAPSVPDHAGSSAARQIQSVARYMF